MENNIILTESLAVVSPLLLCVCVFEFNILGNFKSGISSIYVFLSTKMHKREPY